MTDIILAFSVRNHAPLSCVWIETGNPARPLACKWIVRQPCTNRPSTNVLQSQTHRLWA